MAPRVHVLDGYYLIITFLITLGYQIIGFTIAYTLKIDTVTDFFGGSNVFWLALITLFFNGAYRSPANERTILVAVFVMLWALRIAGFLLFRVIKNGKDQRFDQIRGNFFKFSAFWAAQVVWVWVISYPNTVLQSINITTDSATTPSLGKATDIIGIILWVIGFVFEAGSDIQKFRFKERQKEGRQESNKKVLDTGFFKYSRHPNYFGEISMWSGIFLLAVTVAIYAPDDGSGADLTGGSKAVLYSSVISPVFTIIIILFLSGLPGTEKPKSKKMFEDGEWPSYKEYLESTSILIPLPPSFYRRIPTFIRRTLLFDFPMYQFKPEQDAT